MENLRHHLIDWLNERAHTLETLLKELAEKDIRASQDARYPALYNLKYGSILADKSDPLVRACRGAVVELVRDDGDHSPYFRLVAYAFDRFFNIGEGYCHDLDWDSTRVYEKYDGSLLKCAFYNGEWLASTSGTVAGASEVGSTGRSFAELFWSVFEQVGYRKDMLDPKLCYIFELCHRDNRIVVDYSEPQLPLLAVRDRRNDFEELDLKAFCESSGFKAAESYEFGTLEALFSVVNSRDANHEGFILFDGRGRAKAKSDVYCQMHRVRGNGEPDFSELFLNDDLDEFLLHFPEYAERFEVHLDLLKVLGERAELLVSELSDLNQKDFAIKVLAEAPEISGSCFALRSGKFPTFESWVSSVRSGQLDKLLGIE